MGASLRSFSSIKCCASFIPRIDRVLRSRTYPRHAEIMVTELGLTSENTKTSETPENRDGMESCAEDTVQYRSRTTRAAYELNLEIVSRTWPDARNKQDKLTCSDRKGWGETSKESHE